ncbi:amino acid ABC transporter permease [Neisseria wadsworthii]|uniref:Polar amino acid ABC superfamily ATP binding cassette transporter, membrane protein n=1 Tax=Neisseria wadsworthii 9715 TaxID=1030841 RepID=G4CQD2_9NEIS|nr:amino acid ABC transporter permease [Neisseria wadsworthii]EGZ46380.1 polar amino acid ABC superfamily ATP binding cassette transporter, membrane protein [Neisseria wadsworthii 9715]
MLNNILAALPFMNEAKAQIVIDAFWPLLKAALVYTIPLSIVSFIIGLLIALAVALIRVVPQEGLVHKFFYGVARFYVSVIRGTPLLLQLFIIFYGLPEIGLKLDPVPTAIIAFSLNIGAYASETVRSAILSIPKGQWEAGFSIGMTYMQTFRRIVLPQALRVAVPPLSNTFVGLVKETSLASLVLIPELMKASQVIVARNYEFILIYTEAGLIYWVICTVLTHMQGKMEKRLDRYVAK